MLWPEGAITVSAGRAQGLLDDLSRQAHAAGTAFVLGLPTVERDRDADGYRFFNGVLALGRGEGRYLKKHLVPFGEYVPFESWLRGSIEFFDLPMSSMSSGPEAQRPLDLGGVPAAMAICYEIAFPELVRRQLGEAELLMTVSNDTWFGASIGPAQHMQISRMRAVELGRWLLRATNNGITVIVDHRGRVAAELPQFEAGVLRGSFEARRGRTPYQRFGVMGVLLLALLLCLPALWHRLRRGS